MVDYEATKNRRERLAVVIVAGSFAAVTVAVGVAGLSVAAQQQEKKAQT
jgi:hypothetical protein